MHSFSLSEPFRVVSEMFLRRWGRCMRPFEEQIPFWTMFGVFRV